MSLYNNLEKHKVKLIYIPLAIYWVVIFTLTTIPGPSLPKVFVDLGDKAKHFIAYTVLAVLVTLALRVQNKYFKLKEEYLKFAILFTAVYGIFDEFHQLFIPGRSFDLYDYAMDLLGIAVGTFIANHFIISKESILHESVNEN